MNFRGTRGKTTALGQLRPFVCENLQLIEQRLLLIGEFICSRWLPLS